jgi:hypothetical protein
LFSAVTSEGQQFQKLRARLFKWVTLIEGGWKLIKSRLDGLYLLLLGAVLFLSIGFILERGSSMAMIDFKGAYCSARSLLEHADPYNEDQLRRIYLTEGGARLLDPPVVRRVVIKNLYLPTAFVLTLPFAALQYGPSEVLWISLTAASFILAAFLIWLISSKHAPIASGGLIALLLANSASLLVIGNPAGIALSLCVIAVWCFIQERFILVGVLCLAISLANKPNDGGLVWLYFLIAGESYRKRSIQTLILVAAMCLPVVLWVSSVAPNWPEEQHANLVQTTTNGDLNDPTPSSTNFAGLDTLIQLQTFTSIFWDAPLIYNGVAYLACIPLLLIWMFITLWTRPSPANTWFALAVIAALSPLPIYHRTHDARILLLTLPACVSLWVEGGAIGWFAVLINAAGNLSIGEIPSMIRVDLVNRFLPAPAGLLGKIQMAILTRPVPLILLVTTIFYLWVYYRRAFENGRVQTKSDKVESTGAQLLESQ